MLRVLVELSLQVSLQLLHTSEEHWALTTDKGMSICFIYAMLLQ